MAALLLGCGARHKAHKAAMADPFSPERLERTVQQVLPLIEAHTGRRFTTTPVVQITADETYLEQVKTQQIWIMEQLMPDTPAAMRERMAEQSAQQVAQGALGTYDPISHRVNLLDAVLVPAVQSLPPPTNRLDDAVTLVVAHELVHALEDQVVDLSQTVEDLHDLEQFSAASATWEGLATWVEGKVAEDLGLEDVFWALNQHLQGWGPDGLEKAQAWSTWFRYGQGHDFIAHHHREGGVDAMWQTLESPPASTSMILDPHTWDPTIPQAPRDYRAALLGVEQKLTRGDWGIVHTRVGHRDLFGQAVHDPDGQQALIEAIGHLEWGHMVQLSRPDREGEIEVLVFDDPTRARAWLDLLRDQRTAFNAFMAGELHEAVEVITEPFDEVEADDAILRIERARLGPVTLESHSVWAVRGDTVVMVTAKLFRPGLRLGWTLEAVFEALATSED